MAQENSRRSVNSYPQSDSFTCEVAFSNGRFLASRYVESSEFVHQRMCYAHNAACRWIGKQRAKRTQQLRCFCVASLGSPSRASGIAARRSNIRAPCCCVICIASRKEDCALAREKSPASGWQSRSSGASVLKSKALKFSQDIDLKMSEDNVKSALDRWLSQMPDTESLFSSKKESPQA